MVLANYGKGGDEKAKGQDDCSILWSPRCHHWAWSPKERPGLAQLLWERLQVPPRQNLLPWFQPRQYPHASLNSLCGVMLLCGDAPEVQRQVRLCLIYPKSYGRESPVQSSRQSWHRQVQATSDRRPFSLSLSLNTSLSSKLFIQSHTVLDHSGFFSVIPICVGWLLFLREA